ncbi:MAG: trigger factor [Mariprofundaceae bacterium]
MSIKTEVKALGAHEHAVHVRVPEAKYKKAYAGQIKKLGSQIKLPGFRPGKAPKDVIEQKFGGQARRDAIDKLVSDHYIEALESSGLTPAMQPQIEVPPSQDTADLTFIMKVVTWPTVKLCKLSKLKVDELKVEVDDSDVQQALDQLLAEQISYEEQVDYGAREGDALHIDFTGFISDEPFDGGRGENMRLVLGEGRFIPGFEEGLMGAKAGDQRTLNTKFPDDYNHEGLAGMQARFEVLVRSVAQAKKASSLDELAGFLGFEDVEALKADVLKRLSTETENASRAMNREAAYNALLAAHDIALPEALIVDAIQKNVQRLSQKLQSQGGQLTPEMAGDESFQTQARERSERELRLGVLLNAIRRAGDLSVSEEEINARVAGMAERYPINEREGFMRWFYQQEDQLDGLRDEIMQSHCVAYVLREAKTKQVKQSLSSWRSSQQAREEGGQLVAAQQEAA